MDLSRRSFIAAMSAAGAGGVLSQQAAATDPVRRSGGPHIRLSLAAYSFRDYLSGPRKSMSYEEFLDLAATYDLDGIEATSYYFPETVTPEYLRRFRRHAFLLGLTISGSSVGNSFTQPPGPKLDKEIELVKKWIDRSVDLGAPVMRIFAGSVQKGTTEEQARKWAVDAIQKCCLYAAEKGVVLALENHGGIVTTADQILSLVKEVQSDWFGVNLDTGNFPGPDPYGDLARVAPYAVTVHIKTEIAPARGMKREADLERTIDILKKTGYRGFIALEYEAKEDPKSAVPRHLQALRKLIT